MFLFSILSPLRYTKMSKNKTVKMTAAAVAVSLTAGGVVIPANAAEAGVTTANFTVNGDRDLSGLKLKIEDGDGMRLATAKTNSKGKATAEFTMDAKGTVTVTSDSGVEFDAVKCVAKPAENPAPAEGTNAGLSSVLPIIGGNNATNTSTTSSTSSTSSTGSTGSTGSAGATNTGAAAGAGAGTGALPAGLSGILGGLMDGPIGGALQGLLGGNMDMASLMNLAGSFLKGGNLSGILGNITATKSAEASGPTEATTPAATTTPVKPAEDSALATSTAASTEAVDAAGEDKPASETSAVSATSETETPAEATTENDAAATEAAAAAIEESFAENRGVEIAASLGLDPNMNVEDFDWISATPEQRVAVFLGATVVADPTLAGKGLAAEEYDALLNYFSDKDVVEYFAENGLRMDEALATGEADAGAIAQGIGAVGPDTLGELLKSVPVAGQILDFALTKIPGINWVIKIATSDLALKAISAVPIPIPGVDSQDVAAILKAVRAFIDSGKSLDDAKKLAEDSKKNEGANGGKDTAKPAASSTSQKPAASNTAKPAASTTKAPGNSSGSNSSNSGSSNNAAGTNNLPVIVTAPVQNQAPKPHKGKLTVKLADDGKTFSTIADSQGGTIDCTIELAEGAQTDSERAAAESSAAAAASSSSAAAEAAARESAAAAATTFYARAAAPAPARPAFAAQVAVGPKVDTGGHVEGNKSFLARVVEALFS